MVREVGKSRLCLHSVLSQQNVTKVVVPPAEDNDLVYRRPPPSQELLAATDDNTSDLESEGRRELESLHDLVHSKESKTEVNQK